MYYSSTMGLLVVRIGGYHKMKRYILGDESGEVEDKYLMIINADGTGTMTGDDGLNEFTWTPIDGGFKTKGDMKVTFKDDGDNIKARIFIADLVFVKQ